MTTPLAYTRLGQSMRLALFLAALLVATAAFAGPMVQIQIDKETVPQPLPVGQYCWLNLSDVEPDELAKNLEVVCEHESVTISPPAQWLGTEGVFLLFKADKPGVYPVVLIDCGQPREKRRTKIEITVEGEQGPDPPEPPEPDPPPEPGPKWVMIVYDSEEMTPQLGILKNSEQVKAYCQSHGHKLKWIEHRQSAPADLAKWRDLGVKEGVPRLYVAQKGRKHQSRAPPSTVAEMLSFLKEVDGE